MASRISPFKIYCGIAVLHSYKYDTIIQAFQNDSVNIAACMETEDVPEIQIEPSMEDSKGKTVDYTTGTNECPQKFLKRHQ